MKRSTLILLNTLIILSVFCGLAFAGSALNLTDFFAEWGAIVNTLLGVVSGFFAWFFRNLKAAMKETADVVNTMANTVKEAVDVFDAFVNVIQISTDGTVSIPLDSFAKVEKELKEVKTIAGTFPKELSEMTSAWGNLFSKPKA